MLRTELLLSRSVSAFLSENSDRQNLKKAIHYVIDLDRLFVNANHSSAPQFTVDINFKIRHSIDKFSTRKNHIQFIELSNFLKLYTGQSVRNGTEADGKVD